ncbi:hypothetical protein TX24_14390 [Pseudomonas lactis]|nr:hypothetical protein TX24_14390 [Pseudomonas lactis]
MIVDEEIRRVGMGARAVTVKRDLNRLRDNVTHLAGKCHSRKEITLKQGLIGNAIAITQRIGAGKAASRRRNWPSLLVGDDGNTVGLHDVHLVNRIPGIML